MLLLHPEPEVERIFDPHLSQRAEPEVVTSKEVGIVEIEGSEGLGFRSTALLDQNTL